LAVAEAVAEALETRMLFSSGLTGQYFNSTSLTGYAFNRTDAQVSYTCTASPGSGNGFTLSPSSFSVRWEGDLVAPVTGTYTFDANVDGGERFFINGISTTYTSDDASFTDWTPHSTESSLDECTIPLVAGNTYGIRLEYFSDTATPEAILNWDYSGGTHVAIPSLSLLPLTAAAPTYTPTTPSTVPLTPTTGSLPAGWAQGDLLSATSGNSATYSGGSNISAGTFSLKGTGRVGDVVNDQGLYAYTTVTGDFTMEGEITSISGTNSYGCFAALMMRTGTTTSTLTPDDINYQIGVQPLNGSSPYYCWWSQRTIAGEPATWANSDTDVTTPIYVKMVRGGDTIVGFWSTNGTNWNYGDSQEFNNLPSTVSVGLLASSDSGIQTCTTTFQNVSLGNTSSNNATSWVGNSFGGGLNHIPVAASAAYVNPATGELYITATDEDRGLTIMNADGSILGYGNDSHFGGGSAVAADSSYIFLARAMSNSYIGGVQRYDLNGVPIFSGSTSPYTTLMSTETITGLATFGNYLYVAVNNMVYQFTASTMAFTGFAFEADNAANMTADASGNLWIVQNANGSTPAQVGHFSTTTGQPIAGTINFSGFAYTVVPRGVAVDASGNVYVTDVGELQQIHEYSSSGVYLGDIGYAGGIYGTGGGSAAGQAAPMKFNFPVAVGFDSSGEMYVVNGGPPVPGSAGDCTVVEKFASNSIAAGLEWERTSTTYLDLVSADPNNPSIAYSKFFSYSLNFNTTTPGGEFTITGTLVNPFAYPDDPRLVLDDPLTNPQGDNVSHGPVLTEIDGSNFLIDNDGGGGENIYRFVGPYETVFCAQLYPSENRGKSNDEFAVWTDSNGNGIKDAGETTTYPADKLDNAFGRNIDSRGDIWLADYSGKFEEWIPSSTLNSTGAPTYTLASGAPWTASAFVGTSGVEQLDRAMIDQSGTLYLTGFTSGYPRNPTLDSFFGEAGAVIEEFPDFLTSGFGSGPSVTIPLPYSPTDPMRETTVLGGYIFATYANAGYGVEVYNAASGAHITTLLPSAYEGGGNGAGVDEVDTITAIQLTTGVNSGQFEIFVEDDAEAATTLYRWNPAQTIPTEGWTDQDVGVPTADPTGIGTFNDTTYGQVPTWTLSGSGADIGGTGDQFHFSSTQLFGDGSITAQVDTLSNTAPGAKAGVMMRDSEASSSMFADVVVTPSDGILFQWRSATGSGSSSVSVSGAVPEYIRISRMGNIYTAFYSGNGTTWVQIGSPQTIAFTSESSGNPSLAGLAVTSQSATASATATFTNVIVANPTLASAIVSAGNPVAGTSTTLSVTGADPSGTSTLTYTWAAIGTPPAPVTFTTNGTNAAQNTTANFTKAGNYTLQLTITDSAGFSVVSTYALTVAQTATSIAMLPAGPITVAEDAAQQFTATVYDQFGNVLTSQPTSTWTLAGGSVGTLSTSGLYTAPAFPGTATVQATDGTLTASVSVTTDPAWLSPSSIATWNTSTHILTVTGSTAIIADPGSDEPIVEASGSAAVITLDPSSGTDIHLGGLSLIDDAAATVTSVGSARSTTNYHLLAIGVTGATTAPMFTIDSTSTLNLADNDMAILYGSGTSPLSTVSSALAQAYDGGAWDNPGLTSSIAKTSAGVTALGYGEASTLGLTTFDGLTLGGNAVLVKYTLVGDTQLRGSVGIGDYDTVLSNYGTAQGWTGGDFHYGGTVGIGDYNALLSNYGKTLASVLAASGPAALRSATVSISSKQVTSTVKAKTASVSVAKAKALRSSVKPL
jgi:hypothetical protein